MTLTEHMVLLCEAMALIQVIGKHDRLTVGEAEFVIKEARAICERYETIKEAA